MVSRGEGRTHEPLRWIAGVARNLKKMYQKPLDKPHTMWYNEYVKRGTSAAKAPSTVDNRNRSELPTNSHEIYLFLRSHSGAVRLTAGHRNKPEKWRVAEIMKKVRNFFRKPLDKPNKVCYNLNVIKGRKTLKTRKELILWLLLRR